MARLVELGTLVTRCQKRADKYGDPHVDEWKALISEKYGELYGAVVEAGLSYFVDTEDITATGATSYTSPADEMSIISIDPVVNGTIGSRGSLKLLMPQEHALWDPLTGDASRYAFSGDQILLRPKPSTGTYRVTYVPQSPDLSEAADDTDVDVINTDGEAFLIWGVAAMAKDKGEADLRFAADQSAKALDRLAKWATNRALHEPRRRYTETPDFDPLIAPNDPWYR